MSLRQTEAEVQQNTTILLGTGWLKGDSLSINVGDPSLIDIGEDIHGMIVNSTDGLNINPIPFVYPATSGISTGLGAYEEGFITVKMVGDTPTLEVIRQDLYNFQDSRTNAMIGKVWMNGSGDIEGFGQYSYQAHGVAKLIEDLILATGESRHISGTAISANAINTQQLDKSASTSFRLGAFLADTPDSPNVGTDIAVENVDIYYAYQNSTTWNTITKVVDVDNYDVAGTPTTMVQSIKVDYARYWPKSNVIGIEMGQKTYANVADAKADIGISGHITNTQMYKGSFRVCAIVIQKGQTDLGASAEFIPYFQES